MDILKISPQLRSIYRYLPPLPFHNPRYRPLIQLMIKTLGGTRTASGVRVEDKKLDDAALRIYHPPEASGGGLLWFHGGGFVVGTAAQDNRFCSRVASELGLVVVSVDYRLAPENPFPAALDDCYAAWEWYLDAGPGIGVDPRRIVLSGQSAGGGLAACLAQRILDNGGIQPAAQLLIYPMLDDRTAADRSLDEDMQPLWNNSNNYGGWKAYLGQEPGLPSTPDYASASRREDLTGLPSTWIGVGNIDLFFEENRDYGSRLEAAGVPCEMEIFEGAPHGFNVAVPRSHVSRAFLQSIDQFLRDQLDI